MSLSPKKLANLSLSLPALEPFFEERHARLADRLESDVRGDLIESRDPGRVARALGDAGLYSFLVPEACGGQAVGRPEDATHIDVRSLVLLREALGQRSPLADAILAVQGLGSYPLVLAASEAQRRELLPDIMVGRRIGAFALTEPEAGSDVASMRTAAVRDGTSWVLTGEKTLISNVPIAHHYIVFANADPSAGRRGISAFFVERDAPGLTLSPIAMSIPHPIGGLRLDRCRLAADALLGAVGDGFRIAMQTLDAFRISVGAAANGMAAHALRATLDHITTRQQFGAPLADQPMVRAYVAEMATELDAARLLVARAAHRRDTKEGRVTVEAAMAKMYATEAAQRIIDRAVQLHGGLGVTLGSAVEQLYREVRPLRIYEGTTEIQQLVIAKGVLEAHGRQ
jgi:acyl-CoA dehydrogenase